MSSETCDTATMSADLTRADIHSILRFYADAGVDDALTDVAVNRFAPALDVAPVQSTKDRAEWNTQDRSGSASYAPVSAMARAPVAPVSGTASIPDATQVALASDLARKAGSLEELRALLADFQGCNLRLTAKNLVFADGNPRASLMLVGEAPGREEDIEGLPFVGRSGQLLDRMLKAIGLNRSSVYIANVIPWRPPGNRTPTPQETEICRPFIERQIELANPAVLMTLGGPSAKVILNDTTGVMRMRGNWRVHQTAGGVEIPTMPTLHPAYLLRTPAHKRLAWRDFLEVKARLRQSDR